MMISPSTMSTDSTDGKYGMDGITFVPHSEPQWTWHRQYLIAYGNHFAYHGPFTQFIEEASFQNILYYSDNSNVYTHQQFMYHIHLHIVTPVIKTMSDCTNSTQLQMHSLQ